METQQRREIPILFSTPMVQALLAGMKLQTRRLIKPQPIDNTEVDGNFFEGRHRGYVKVDGHPSWRDDFAREFSRWKSGDILWVREAWNHWDVKSMPYVYKATDLRSCGHTWKPSIHMPKAAARIWLQIEEVRMERLHDISEEDAIAEGILSYRSEVDNRPRYKDYLASSRGYGNPDYDYPTVGVAVTSFSTLWRSINGAESWEANPWIWVVKFKVLSTTGKPTELVKEVCHE